MNWQAQPRMHNADPREEIPRKRVRRAAAALIVALACLVLVYRDARAAAPRYGFAIIADALQAPGDEVATQRLIETIGLTRGLSFIAYDGNLKGADEACEDALYERRQQLLETSRAPLDFIPGRHDCVDYGTAQAGNFDSVERPDCHRQTGLALSVPQV